MERHFYIRNLQGKYGDQWLVIRKRDWALLHSGSLFGCCQWVSVWGNTPLALHRHAAPVSEVMRW